jgi:membrane associated rhomboid family serine protease
VITSAEVRGQATRSAPVSMTILGLNVVIWLLTFLAGGFQEAALELGAQANLQVAQGEWYRLFTTMFLHSPFTITHILFNMLALYIFGPQLEREAGSVPFAALYFASGLAGGAAFFLLAAPGASAVGASGAIFGLFGGWIAAFVRRRESRAGRSGLRQLLVLLGINLALPLIVPGIAWQAHLGGLVAGFLIVLAWTGIARRSRDARVARTLVGVGVGLLALAGVLIA